MNSINAKHSALHELSTNEMAEVHGGDYFDQVFGVMFTAAMFAGALAMPELLILSAIGCGLMYSDYNWY